MSSFGLILNITVENNTSGDITCNLAKYDLMIG